MMRKVTADVRYRRFENIVVLKENFKIIFTRM